MSKEKNSSFVAIIRDLTESQSASLQAEMIKRKNKIAPNARATMASTNEKDGIKKILQNDQKQLKGD